MENPNNEEDIITIHLGRVLTEQQYNEVVNSVISFMNKRWPEFRATEFAS